MNFPAAAVAADLLITACAAAFLKLTGNVDGQSVLPDGLFDTMTATRS